MTQPQPYTLTVRDQLFLLAHDEQGRPRIHTPSLNLGLAGAVLADLVLAERLAVTADAIALRSLELTGDVINDAVLQTIHATARRDRALNSWLQSLSIDIADRVGGRLHAAGLVNKTIEKKMFRQPTAAYWCTDPLILGRVTGALRFAVDGSKYVDPGHLVLCDLLAVLRLHRLLHIDLPATDLLQRLTKVGAAAPSGARHVVWAVERLIGETAVAAMR